MNTDRRVAACVAACEGLNTEALAAGELARLLTLVRNTLPLLKAAKLNGSAARLRAKLAALEARPAKLAEAFSGYVYRNTLVTDAWAVLPDGHWEESLADIPAGAAPVGRRVIDGSEVAVFALEDGTYAAVMPHCLKWA